METPPPSPTNETTQAQGTQPRTRRERRAALAAQAKLEKVSWSIATQAWRRVCDTSNVVRIPYKA